MERDIKYVEAFSTLGNEIDKNISSCGRLTSKNSYPLGAPEKKTDLRNSMTTQTVNISRKSVKVDNLIRTINQTPTPDIQTKEFRRFY